MGFIGSWLSTAIATAVAIWVVPGIEAVGGSWAAPIFTALVLGILNATVKPVLKVLSFPVTVLTLGIFSLFVNAVVLELASFFSRNIFHAGIYVSGFGAALLGAIVISVVGTLVNGVID